MSMVPANDKRIAFGLEDYEFARDTATMAINGSSRSSEGELTKSQVEYKQEYTLHVLK